MGFGIPAKMTSPQILNLMAVFAERGNDQTMGNDGAIARSTRYGDFNAPPDRVVY